jgi:hypothetical protein
MGQKERAQRETHTGVWINHLCHNNETASTDINSLAG